jgi:hypothetical protein
MTRINVYDESGLKLDFTNMEVFRLADLRTYEKVKGRSVKEIDFIFIHNQKLYFLEIEDFTHPLRKPKQGEVENLTSRLIKKSEDTLLLMSSVWIKTQAGQQLRQEGIPAVFSKFQPFTIIHGLDLPTELQEHFEALNSNVTAALSGKISLFDSKVVVLKYEKLLEYFPFIQRQAGCFTTPDNLVDSVS